jgi:hypothetical protein
MLIFEQTKIGQNMILDEINGNDKIEANNYLQPDICQLSWKNQ